VQCQQPTDLRRSNIAVQELPTLLSPVRHSVDTFWPLAGDERFDLPSKPFVTTSVGPQDGTYPFPNLQSSLVGNRKLNLDCPDRHGLRGTEHVYCPQPILEGNLGALEYRADRHGELTTTCLAPVQTIAVGLLHATYLRDGGSTGSATDIRTHRTIRPPQLLKRHTGGGLVMEDWVGGLKSAGHA
jgi:hypothetical protein